MGYAYITFDPPKLSDAERFLNAVAVGADMFRYQRDVREAEKAGRVSGVIETITGRDVLTEIWKLDLEAFGPTREWVDLIVARELREHPYAAYETRFEAVTEVYDGFRARGSRLAERKQ